MTELFLYAAGFFALLDTSFTYARLREAPSAELNPLVKLINRMLGPLAASLLGVLALQVLLSLVFAKIAPSALHVLVGIGAYRSFGQILSHYSGIEAEVVKGLKDAANKADQVEDKIDEKVSALRKAL